jgi:hypothetical protein
MNSSIPDRAKLKHPDKPLEYLNSTRRRLMRLRHAIEVGIASMHDCKEHGHHHKAKAFMLKELHKDRLIAAKNKVANESREVTNGK